jgi:hypothetical protein
MSHIPTSIFAAGFESIGLMSVLLDKNDGSFLAGIFSKNRRKHFIINPFQDHLVCFTIEEHLLNAFLRQDIDLLMLIRLSPRYTLLSGEKIPLLLKIATELSLAYYSKQKRYTMLKDAYYIWNNYSI